MALQGMSEWRKAIVAVFAAPLFLGVYFVMALADYPALAADKIAERTGVMGVEYVLVRDAAIENPINVSCLGLQSVCADLLADEVRSSQRIMWRHNRRAAVPVALTLLREGKFFAEGVALSYGARLPIGKYFDVIGRCHAAIIQFNCDAVGIKFDTFDRHVGAQAAFFSVARYPTLSGSSEESENRNGDGGFFQPCVLSLVGLLCL
jgi:hypothetical protein